MGFHIHATLHAISYTQIGRHTQKSRNKQYNFFPNNQLFLSKAMLVQKSSNFFCFYPTKQKTKRAKKTQYLSFQAAEQNRNIKQPNRNIPVDFKPNCFLIQFPCVVFSPMLIASWRHYRPLKLAFLQRFFGTLVVLSTCP